ncbi:MAG: SCO family protein [Burkholderiaceae bacterium]|nr:SCO family protein [Burkholderiaceae bacterium]MDH3459707.1 SCO family protein [Burkholderiaceae bacterium]
MRTFIAQLIVPWLAVSAALAAQANPAPLPSDSIYHLDAPLTDQSGRRLTLASKRGSAQLVVMFYTSCKYICPTIVDTVLDLDRKLAPAQRQQLGVLLISLDPQRDDPTALKTLADKRGLDLTRWTLVQPQVADVRAIAGVLGVRYRALSDGEFNHTGALVLLDADGRIAARSAQTSGEVEPQFMSSVRAMLGQP